MCGVVVRGQRITASQQTTSPFLHKTPLSVPESYRTGFTRRLDSGANELVQAAKKKAPARPAIVSGTVITLPSASPQKLHSELLSIARGAIESSCRRVLAEMSNLDRVASPRFRFVRRITRPAVRQRRPP